MYTVKVEIEGIVPLKINRVPISYAEDISKGGGVKLSVPILKECEEKTYKDENGYYLPSTMINAVILNGLSLPKPLISSRVKIFKKTAKACVFVNSNGYLKNGKSDIKWVPDTNFVPTMNGLAVQNRPMFKEGWKTEFEVTCVQDWLIPDVLKEGIIRAGLCHGVGSNRPLFGRFVLRKFEVVKD